MNTPNKKSAYSPAVTILITTASIAAALTGWAIFANRDASSDASASSVTAVAAVPSNSYTVAASPKPLPTLVPLIGTTPQAQSAAPSAQSQTKQAAPTVQPTAPTIQQPARNTNQAPRPLARSRSSR